MPRTSQVRGLYDCPRLSVQPLLEERAILPEGRLHTFPGGERPREETGRPQKKHARISRIGISLARKDCHPQGWPPPRIRIVNRSETPSWLSRSIPWVIAAPLQAVFRATLKREQSAYQRTSLLFVMSVMCQGSCSCQGESSGQGNPRTTSKCGVFSR